MTDFPTGNLGGVNFPCYVITGFSHDVTGYRLTNTTGYQALVTFPDSRTMAIDLHAFSSGTLTIGLPLSHPAVFAMLDAGLGLVGAEVLRRRSTG